MSDVSQPLREALAGRYRLEREVGRGGSATVYLADDLKHGRQVALKVLRSEFAEMVGRDRFLEEIQTTARLEHSHILSLYDSGEAAGYVFYVMPYVKDESLRDRLNRDGQLPIGRAVEIAKQVGAALEFAHSLGIVHRDVKPANILLPHGHAMLADFGIAKVVDDAGRERVTQAGISIGTATGHTSAWIGHKSVWSAPAEWWWTGWSGWSVGVAWISRSYASGLNGRASRMKAR